VQWFCKSDLRSSPRALRSLRGLVFSARSPPDISDREFTSDRGRQALDEQGRAAKAERHPEVSRFVEEPTAHAQTEEQVFYSAAILVGEYLKLKFPAVR
jgi:hypothetical protein